LGKRRYRVWGEGSRVQRKKKRMENREQVIKAKHGGDNGE
jgi:hypothetical protein